MRTDSGDFSATLTFIAVGDDQKLTFSAAGAPDRSLTLYLWPYRAGAPKADVQAIRAIAVSPAPGTSPAAFATYRIRARIDDAASSPLAMQVQYSNVGAESDAAGAWKGLLFSEPIVVP